MHRLSTSATAWRHNLADQQSRNLSMLDFPCLSELGTSVLRGRPLTEALPRLVQEGCYDRIPALVKDLELLFYGSKAASFDTGRFAFAEDITLRFLRMKCGVVFNESEHARRQLWDLYQQASMLKDQLPPLIKFELRPEELNIGAHALNSFLGDISRGVYIPLKTTTACHETFGHDALIQISRNRFSGTVQELVSRYKSDEVAYDLVQLLILAPGQTPLSRLCTLGVCRAPVDDLFNKYGLLFSMPPLERVVLTWNALITASRRAGQVLPPDLSFTLQENPEDPIKKNLIAALSEITNKRST